LVVAVVVEGTRPKTSLVQEEKAAEVTVHAGTPQRPYLRRMVVKTPEVAEVAEAIQTPTSARVVKVAQESSFFARLRLKRQS